MSNRIKYLIAIGIAVLVVSVGVLYILFPTYPEHTQFAAYLVGGLLLLLQIGVSSYRATVAEKTAKAAQKTSEVAQITAEAAQKTAEAMQKTAESTEKGNVAERFKNAIEHLGNKSASVRMGGIYALHHIAQEEENYRARVFEVLCSHVKETTTHKYYKPTILMATEKDVSLQIPAIEVQSILDLLFVLVDSRVIYKDRLANLTNANLKGARLTGSNLISANLMFANLEKSFLGAANLSNAVLFGARLAKASLINSNLNKTNFRRANLRKISVLGSKNLTINQLSEAKFLYKAKLPNGMENMLRKQKPALFIDPNAKTTP